MVASRESANRQTHFSAQELKNSGPTLVKHLYGGSGMGQNQCLPGYGPHIFVHVNPFASPSHFCYLCLTHRGFCPHTICEMFPIQKAWPGLSREYLGRLFLHGKVAFHAQRAARSRSSRFLQDAGKPTLLRIDPILRMDEILHHFETMGNHNLLVFTGNQSIPGLLRWCKILSIHSINRSVCFFGGGVPTKPREKHPFLLCRGEIQNAPL